MRSVLGRCIGDYGLLLLFTWAQQVVELVTADGESVVTTTFREKREVLFFFNNNNSHVGRTASSVMDATFLVGKIRALLMRGWAGEGRERVCGNTSATHKDQEDGDVTVVSEQLLVFEIYE
ncbi:hypothetical protein TRVL_02165 [Trypanosoma vivax]|nr:hypothetical protein TRVL_02165 [Trypanosoma vivax]